MRDRWVDKYIALYADEPHYSYILQTHRHTHTATQSRVLAKCPDWQINIFRASYPLMRRFYFQFPLLSLRLSPSPSHTLRIRNEMCVYGCGCVWVSLCECHTTASALATVRAQLSGTSPRPPFLRAPRAPPSSAFRSALAGCACFPLTRAFCPRRLFVCRLGCRLFC